MNQQDLKNYIRGWVKSNQAIDSDLGEIVIGPLLGEGGNALVFDSPFAGGTAIKILAESVSSPSSTRYTRFLDEYRNLIRLVPTGAIVPLYQFGVLDMQGQRMPYIVMERCVTTLYNMYKSDKLVDVTEFDRLLERLLWALEIVHNASIVHRDIKPQNILLRQNGEWVLGDFGIAWFDPEMHIKLAKTEKNERLANFEFSAPEQIRRQAYNKPAPSMDLYALGQTLYYCVTGHVIRGSGYPRFSQAAPALGRYDLLIEMLVKQVPSERFQSIGEVRKFLEEQRSSKKKLMHDRDLERMNAFVRSQEMFDRAISSSMPGSYNYAQTNNEVEINRVMSSLAKYCEACNLWWFAGLSHSPACPIKKLFEDIWLIQHQECKIIDLWLYRHPTIERQYILVKLAARSPFFTNDTDKLDFSMHDEAGFYKGRYVTRGEYDDGYAVIDGEVVELEGVELRVRNCNYSGLLLLRGLPKEREPAKVQL